MTWVVMCRVSGGVTGTRTAPLKKDGRVAVFTTEEEARQEANRQQSAPRSQYSLADFHYWPEEDK